MLVNPIVKKYRKVGRCKVTRVSRDAWNFARLLELQCVKPLAHIGAHSFENPGDGIVIMTRPQGEQNGKS